MSEEYEEIDLRDYIKVLLRQKWIVICLTLGAIIGATVVNFFILKPVYQAKAILLVPKFTPAVVSKSMTIEEYINLQTLVPKTLSPDAYAALLKTPALEREIINTLNLRNFSGEILSPDELEKMVEIEAVKNTDLIQIRVEHYNPQKAAEIANTWARLFVEESKKSDIQSALSSEEAVRKQLEIAKMNLMKAEEEKKDFQKRNRILVLEKQVNSKVNKIAEFNARLSDIDRLLQKTKMEIKIWLFTLIKGEMSAYESRLADIRLILLKQKLEKGKIKDELKGQTKTLILRESLIKDEYLAKLLADLTEQSAISLGNLGLESEKVNPIYQNLKQRLVNLNISQEVLIKEAEELEGAVGELEKILSALQQQLSNDELEYQRLPFVVHSILSKLRKVQLGSLRSSIAKKLEGQLVDATISIQSLLEEKRQLKDHVKRYSEELNELQVMLETEKLKLKDLERKLRIAESTCEMLSKKLEEARIATTMKTDKVKIASLAAEPKRPIKPRKKQNILISGILGLFGGVLVAFFVDWWTKGGANAEKRN